MFQQPPYHLKLLSQFLKGFQKDFHSSFHLALAGYEDSKNFYLDGK